MAIGSTAAIDDLTTSQILFGGTIAAWGFGGPVIHSAHGNRGTAFKSLGLRWGLPLAVGALLYQVGDESSDPDCEFICVNSAQTNFVEGYLLGGVIAQSADWFAWSYTSKPASESTLQSRLVPSLSVGPQGAYLGLGATF